MRKRLFLSFVLLSVSVSAAIAAGPYRIDVRDQRQFDLLSASVMQAVKQGHRSVFVDVAPGVFYFKDAHVSFEGLDWRNVELTLHGSGETVLVGDGSEGIFDGSGFRSDRCYLDGRLQPCRLCTEMRRAAGLVTVKDKKRGLCVLDTGDRNLTVSDCKDVYIQVTEWYTSHMYPVQKIRRGKVHFVVSELTPVGLQYNVNADFHYGLQLPRYRFLNLPEMRGKWLHACEAARFLLVSGCSFKSFVVEGFTFRGSSADERLIHFQFCRAGCYTVRECRFESIMREAVFSSYTADVSVEDNVATGCAGRVFVADHFSPRARIVGNRLSGNGIALQSGGNIECSGEDFLIADNVISDYGYCAITTGVYFWEEPGKYKITGTVRSNEVFQSPEAYDAAPMEGLMDSGAIYVNTMNDDVIIRDNYIHDINGPHDNRGIFCDDGTVNVHILDNRVLRVANSYTIDLRRVVSVENHPKTRVPRTNIGNSMSGNTVDGPVRFERRGGNDGCSVGNNKTVVRTKRPSRP